MLLAVGTALRGLFAVLIDVLDALLVDQQVWAAEAGQLDAVAVVPLDRSVKNFAVRRDHRDRRLRLHLLHPVEILRMGLFGTSGLLVGLLAAKIRTPGYLLLD